VASEVKGQDARPVSFGQNCLHFTFKPTLSSETYSRKYENLPYVVIYAIMHVNILQIK